ncbi:MAG TPA: sugar phosphate nucleotidyltransferase [Bacilli bacterium]
MKGVILAAGKGTRLLPMTAIINKHLLPAGKFPVIYYAVRKLRDAGILDILIVIGKHSAGAFLDFLGSGNEFGVKITYKVQEESGGVAHALALARDFVGKKEKFVVLLGDNLFEDSLAGYVEQFKKQKDGAMVLLKEVKDPWRFGVPILVDSQIIWIEEKPTHPKSPYCVAGIYMYSGNVFDIISGINPSNRGELEITDVNNVYAAEGKLNFNLLNGWWTDAGTFDSLYEAVGRLLNSPGDGK